MKLYRAAKNTDIETGSTCFARRLDDAREYTKNPGFGGASLWCLDIEIDSSEILDLRTAIPRWIAAEIDGLGAVGLDEAVTAHGCIQRVIRAAGFRWVVLIDSFPDECETWVVLTDGGSDWYGDDEVAPNMTECRE